MNKNFAQKLEEFLHNREEGNMPKKVIMDPNFSQRSPRLEEKIKFVPMSGIDVTCAQDNQPYIGTTSLASCAGIAIYDFKNKVAGVAHIFFNKKDSLVVYEFDSKGREIPSTGRAITIDNPLPFEPFRYSAQDLVRRADEIGGEKYKFTTFNVKGGCRTPTQNEQLKSVVGKTIDVLTREGKITEVEHRHEQDFMLDSRNGARLPYFHQN